MAQFINFFFAIQAIIVGLLIIVILGQQSSSGLGGLAGVIISSNFLQVGQRRTL